ncbi:MAG: hypothetical protein ACRDJM_10050, partial [Actinomycetota bacterium]
MPDPADDARRALLAALFDDAGLFPPASLSMGDAVAAHRRARHGQNRWMLARFVCPASRLDELARLLAERDDADPWRVSAILDGPDARVALETTERFGASVDTVETRAPDIHMLAKTLDASGFRGFAFAEVAPGPAWRDALADVRAAADAGVRIGAKIRCGGEAVPQPEMVAAFIVRCRDLGIRFKATAGLHHPVGHRAPEGQQHGFLNLGVAATLAYAHPMDQTDLRPVIEEQDPASF